MSLPKEKVGEIVSDVMNADLEQLRTINKILVSRIKDKKKEKASKIKSKLFKGLEVKFVNAKKLAGQKGVIEKVKRTRADVRVDGQIWDVPIACLKPLDAKEVDINVNKQ